MSNTAPRREPDSDEDKMVGCRVDAGTVNALDEAIARRSKTVPGVRLTRSDMVRIAIAQFIERESRKR